MEAKQKQTARPGNFVIRSVDETLATFSGLYYDVHLDVPGVSDDFVADVSIAELGALTVARMTFGTQIKTWSSDLGAYQVSVPLTGFHRVWQGQGPATYATTSRAVVVDPAANTLSDDWSADCVVLTTSIDKAALVRQLETLLGRPVHRRPLIEPTLDIDRGPGRSWVDLVSWCLLDRTMPDGLLRQPMFAGRIEQALLEGLLLATDHQYRAALEAPPPSMRPAAVKRVMDAVREQPTEPFDASQLAAIAQVSLRTLQDAFQKNLGMSPMAYVHEVRLQRARQELRIAVPGVVTVSDVAYRWGFAHLGRFAQRYRIRFGETPSQTLHST
jgi:AraC-like DNA-binding protein